MRDVSIIGIGQTPVGEHWDRSLRQLGAEAARAALVNSGTIRRNLDAGPITALDIHELLPFSNVLITVDLTADQLGRHSSTSITGT